MYIQAISDNLVDLFVVRKTIVQPVNGGCALETFELLQEFLWAFQYDYEMQWLNNGNIYVEASNCQRFEKLATVLHELLEHDRSEMDTKECAIVSRFLNNIKCSFEAEQLHGDHWEIVIYM